MTLCEKKEESDNFKLLLACSRTKKKTNVYYVNEALMLTGAQIRCKRRHALAMCTAATTAPPKVPARKILSEKSNCP
jgi:hypothetical protein